jgi:hypothetical protein
LWSFPGEREAISKFEYENKNILEVVAESRGLTPNLIDILWGSRNFSVLPRIKNRKSKTIIYARYNILE